MKLGIKTKSAFIAGLLLALQAGCIVVPEHRHHYYRPPPRRVIIVP